MDEGPGSGRGEMLADAIAGQHDGGSKVRICAGLRGLAAACRRKRQPESHQGEGVRADLLVHLCGQGDDADAKRPDGPNIAHLAVRAAGRGLPRPALSRVGLACLPTDLAQGSTLYRRDSHTAILACQGSKFPDDGVLHQGHRPTLESAEE